MAPQHPSAAREAADRRLDVELEQTFPASDPIPWIHDAPRRISSRADDAAPHGDDHGLRAIGDGELRENRLEVPFHRVLRDG